MVSLVRRMLGSNVAAFCGIVGPFYAFMCIMIAILVSPWFEWTGNALSDLGHPLLHPTSAIVFNSGLVIAGIVTIFFVLGLGMNVRKNVFALLGTGMLLVATVSLICVGLFNETFTPWHFIFSVALFSSMALSLLIFGVAMLINRRTRWFGIATLLLGVIAASPWLLMPWQPAAVPEAISAVTAYIWILMMTTRLGSGAEVIPKKK